MRYDAAMHEWQVTQGRLTGMNGTPVNHKIAAIKALALKRREIKFKVWKGKFLSKSSLALYDSLKNAKQRLLETQTLVSLMTDSAAVDTVSVH